MPAPGSMASSTFTASAPTLPPTSRAHASGAGPATRFHAQTVRMTHGGDDLIAHALQVAGVRARRFLISQLADERIGVIVLAGLDHTRRSGRVGVGSADQDGLREDAAALHD